MTDERPAYMAQFDLATPEGRAKYEAHINDQYAKAGIGNSEETKRQLSEYYDRPAGRCSYPSRK